MTSLINNDISISLYQAISSEEQREHGLWHASSMADCPRAHYFKRLGVKPTSVPSAARMLRWKAGHAIEEAIRPFVKQTFPDVTSNVRFTKGDLTGEYDNLSHETFIEIKSVSDQAFIERDGQTTLKEFDGFSPPDKNGKSKRRWKSLLRPHLNHAVQQHTLVLLSDKPITNLVYIYVSLNGRIVVYKTGIDPEITRLVQARLDLLNEAWSTNVPPSCICDDETHPLYGPVMQYCQYKNTDNDTCCNLSLISKEAE